MRNRFLERFTKEQLIDLIELYSKNWLAMDGVWFQSIENELGIAEAMKHDSNAWSRFTKIEAQKIKHFLKLPENSGIDGLSQALSLRFYANINKDEIIIKENELIYRVLECRVQNARSSKGMEFHPCKPVGVIEYTEFAKVIDSRFECEALSCYPEITDSTCSCSWKFTLTDEKKREEVL
jgi:hypothetical protein